MHSRIAQHVYVTHNVIQRTQQIKVGQKFNMHGYRFQYVNIAIDMEDDYSIFIYLGKMEESEKLGTPCPSCFAMFWGVREVERNSENACYGNINIAIFHKQSL